MQLKNNPENKAKALQVCQKNNDKHHFSACSLKTFFAQVIKYMQSQVVRRKQQQGGYRPDLLEGGSKWLLWRRHQEEALLRENERKVQPKET